MSALNCLSRCAGKSKESDTRVVELKFYQLCVTLCKFVKKEEKKGCEFFFNSKWEEKENYAFLFITEIQIQLSLSSIVLRGCTYIKYTYLEICLKCFLFGMLMPDYHIRILNYLNQEVLR